jgi:hypothetical protein
VAYLLKTAEFYLMFVVLYILVTYTVCLIHVQLDVHYILYFFLDNVSSTCFGYYLHPSPGAQLQRTAIGFVWFGVFIPLEQVPVLGNFNTLARSVTDCS